MNFQFIDVPECLSSWKVQGTDLKNGHFLYFAAFFRGIVVYAVRLEIRDRAHCEPIEYTCSIFVEILVCTSCK